MDASPPNLCTNSAHILNNFGSSNRKRNETLFSRDDKAILSVLETLEQKQSTCTTDRDRISGYLCSDTVFNSSKKVL